MNAFSPDVKVARHLNHIEFVHRPGERALVREFFELLGVTAQDAGGGRWLIGVLDPITYNNVDNIVAGSEVRPEQWAFDQALAEALRHEPLASKFAAHQEMLTANPQSGMHFGIRLVSADEWDATVQRIRDIETHAPALAGRVRLCGAFYPDQPGALATTVRQAFIWTDLIASGSLALGQRIELQVRQPQP